MQCNRELAQQHLDFLFGNAKPYDDGRVELAWTDPDDSSIKHAASYDLDDLDRLVEDAATLNEERRNIYVGAALRDPNTAPFGRSTKRDFYATTCLWFDFDTQEQITAGGRALQELGLRPHWVTVTGTKPSKRAQAFVRLTSPVNSAAWLEVVLKTLQAVTGSDPVYDATRVMRLAGTVSHPGPKKRERGYVPETTHIQILDGERPAIEPDRVEAILQEIGPEAGAPVEPSEPPQAPQPATGAPTPMPAARPATEPYRDTWGRFDFDKCRNDIRPGHWHNPVRSFTMAAVAQGWPTDAIMLALAPHADGGAKDPDVYKLINDARAKVEAGQQHSEARPDEFDGQERARWRLMEDKGMDDLPEPVWLVEQLLTEGGLAVIYGRPNSGKSFLALDLCRHLLERKNWQGRQTTAPPQVLYVLGEGLGGFKSRLRAWRHHHGTGMRHDFAVMPDVLKLDAQGEKEAFAAWLEDLGWHGGVIVVDTASRALLGVDSDPMTMALLIAALDYLRTRLQCTVIIVHHTGIDETRMRGSTILAGAADTVLKVETTETGLMTVTTEKQRDGALAEPIQLQQQTVEFPMPGAIPTTGSSLVLVEADPQPEAETDTASSSRGDVVGINDGVLEALRQVMPPDARMSQHELVKRLIEYDAQPSRSTWIRRIQRAVPTDSLRAAKIEAEGERWGFWRVRSVDGQHWVYRTSRQYL